MPVESNEQKDDASDAGQREASEQGSKPPPQVPPLVPSPNAPQPPPASEPAKNNPNKWRENTKLCLQIFGVVLLFAYTWFSCLQWLQIRWTNRLTRDALSGSNTALTQTLAKMQSQIDEMHTLATNAGKQATQTTNLAQTSRDALVQVQRAVMAVTTLDVSREAGRDGKVANVLLLLHWKNVGSTPTKNLTFRHNYLASPQPLPNNFAYSDIPDAPGTNSNTPSFAAPQGTVSATPVKIPIFEAQEIVDKKLVLTMWGHADYRDVFKGTPRHTSQYCFVISGFYGNIYSTNPTETTVPVTENCKTHNCHDEGCTKK